ncbi:MAG TPA: transporter substrate-binding domain-containing protein [Geminicoccus sp.]|uniref:transglycosylase SLT domain-containing protein n=1 Tax=Geminicoccus sp. TaxID=2024832 RepID=UPI002B80163E|nr:transporter substrate-binding domain-containing protein [Geminicoccus sp.]HWL68941.1 transporter substrate-binding domain-containing protein [Geminicoccus sp.]
MHFLPLSRRVFIAGAMAMALPGRADAEDGPVSPVDELDPVLQNALTPWTGDLDEMAARGFIRVAVPFGLATCFFDGPHQMGPTYDLLVEFEKSLRTQLGKRGSEVTLVILPTSRADLFPALNEGLADIAAGNLTITPERAAVADFSIPFRDDVREVLVTGPAAPAVHQAEDMLGTPVHVRRSSSFFEHLEELNARRVADGLEPFPVVAADEHLQVEDLLEMVNVGLIPATIADDPEANYLAQVLDQITVHQDIALRENQQIAWAVRKDSPKLRRAIDRFMQEHAKGTLLGNVIIRKYLDNIKWIRNALSPEDQERLREVAQFIRMYADEYSFDWLMIMAQAYQESGLDQSKRSPEGAIGVMQILPATAADRNVGIENIHLLEPNIHAGVKYLRFLRDRYFSDPEIAGLDQLLFAFAAYNSGPRNVARARTRAAKSGFDPDIWFNNVEIAAGRAISREPVTYVRNIYKYYVAYRLMTI